MMWCVKKRRLNVIDRETVLNVFSAEKSNLEIMYNLYEEAVNAYEQMYGIGYPLPTYDEWIESQQLTHSTQQPSSSQPCFIQQTQQPSRSHFFSFLFFFVAIQGDCKKTLDFWVTQRYKNESFHLYIHNDNYICFHIF